MRFRVAAALALLALVPRVVSGQQTAGVVAGQVRDVTAGVLPGVTVEIASSALIERVRSVVTGDDGQYRIVDLPPGEYTVTFTLAGFGKFVRDKVQLTSGFTATVNAELKVGEVTETITVSGASPVVDLQNVTQQSVLGKVVIDTIPQGGMYGSIGRLVPGVDAAGNTGGVDVGGSRGRDSNKLVIHGSATNDFKLMIDGIPQGAFAAGNGGDNVAIPPSNSIAEEVNLQYASLPAEVETGGVLMNMVPRTGGDTFRSTVFGNFANTSMQGTNVDATLRSEGILTGGKVDYVSDVNGSLGGPIQRSRLWFFVTYRDFRPYQYSSEYFNANPTGWTYVPDTSKPPALDANPQKTFNTRFTWQATQRNRISLGLELSRLNQVDQLIGGNPGSAINTAEATPNSLITYVPVLQMDWTAPVSNRLLIDVGGQIYRANWFSTPQNGISVAPGATELQSGINFRSSTSALGIFGYGGANMFHDYLRAAVSYTTGSHAIKIGGTLWQGGINTISNSQGFGPYTVQLLSGVPNKVIYRVDPLYSEVDFVKGALFAQDQWTFHHLTANYGLRVDTINTSTPNEQEPATAYFPARDFAAANVLRWRDLSPRLGVAYDLFGNGKTAVKFSINRYVAAEAQTTTQTAAPASAAGTSLQRQWTDTNGDFVPQGDPTNPAANGELGPSPNANWGQPIPTTHFDPAWAQGGWGVRGYNWERAVSVQQELRSNMSVNFGFFYRTYGNFTVTDNVATASTDYSAFCVTSASDPRLPGGGNHQICGLYDVNPSAVSKLNNVVTLSNRFGKIQQNYKGIDLSVNARLVGVLLQGGLNAGRELFDDCAVIGALPELLISGSTKMPASYCHEQQPWLPQVKLIGSYELPWALSMSAAYLNSPNYQGISNFYQGQPRMGIMANEVFTNAQIAPSLGRSLAAGPTANATINVQTPGTLWGNRLQQLDLRFARTFKTGHRSIKGMVDLYNALNANTVLTKNATYGTTGASWLVPLAIVPARLLKLGVQLDF